MADQNPNNPNEGGRNPQRQGGDMGEQAREFLGGAGDRMRDLGQTAREQAQAGGAALGAGMRNLASTLRQNVPQEGMMGTAASNLADTLERGGHYLEEEGLGHLVNDLGTLVRRNPLPAVCIGIGLGFLFAQMFRSER